MKLGLLLILSIHMALVWRVIKTKQIHDVLAIAISVHVVFWYIAPAMALMAFSYDSISGRLFYSVGEERFFFAYFLQSFATWMVVIAFIFLSKRKKLPRVVVRGGRFSERFLWGIVGLYIALIFMFSASRIGLYIENNSAEIYAGRAGGEALFSILLLLILSYAVYVVGTIRKFTAGVYGLLLVLVIHVIVDLLSGSRIAVLIPFFVLFLRYFDRSGVRFKHIVFWVASFIVIANIVIPIVYATQIARQSESFGVDEIATAMKEEIKKQELAKVVFVKTDSFSSGYVLVKMSGYGVAGIRPYIGSVLNFIPRSIMPSRPVAGSMDGTILGHPSRLVPAALYSVHVDSVNYGVSPLHITLWQFGDIGYLIFVVAGVAYWVIINRLLHSYWLYKKVFGIFLIGLPSLATLLPSPDVMIKQLVVVMILMLIAKVGAIVFGASRNGNYGSREMPKSNRVLSKR